MTDEQRQQIATLRDEGNGYKKIAQVLGLSENTVKSFCKRKKMGGIAINKQIENDSESHCQCCGVAITQTPGRKKKKFCSDKCRMKWWNSHLDQVKRKANYDYVCPCCKKTFTVYGNANRKYCSMDCYFEDRYGGARK